MKSSGFAEKIITQILNNKERNRITFIQRYLCSIILPNYDDFVISYEKLKNSKRYENFDEFLSFIFGIDYSKMKIVMNKLNDYKNAVGNDTIPQCMRIKISI